MTDTLRYALAAAHRGWHVFPLRPRSKRPARGFTDWEDHATSDADLLRTHWQRHPHDNVAVATGPSGLVVVDLDLPKGGEEPPDEWRRPGITNGEDVLAALAEEHSEDHHWLDTFTVRTRRGGTHLYYSAPTPAYRNTAGTLGWLVDTRATGGYVVGPGSHVSDEEGTGFYEVTNPAPVAPLPRWLAALLEPTRPEPVTAGQTHQALLDPTNPGLATYVTRALRGEVNRVLSAPVGRRNHALNCAAFAAGTLVGAGILPKHLAEDQLTHAARAIGLDPQETEATIRSGLHAGIARPRGVPT